MIHYSQTIHDRCLLCCTASRNDKTISRGKCSFLPQQKRAAGFSPTESRTQLLLAVGCTVYSSHSHFCSQAFILLPSLQNLFSPRQPWTKNNNLNMYTRGNDIIYISPSTRFMKVIVCIHSCSKKCTETCPIHL